MAKQKADVICLQEIRAHEAQIPQEVHDLDGYWKYWQFAERPGYSGVGILTRLKPDKVISKFDHPYFDKEGRFIQIDIKDLSVVSLYMPSGTSGDVRQKIKYECLDLFEEFLKKIKKKKRHYIICGDFNIAHTPMDIKNAKANEKRTGFLPEERAWMTKIFEEHGYIDAYRHFNPDKIEYTWWSNRANARQNNVGWRIDYHVLSPSLKGKVKSTHIYREKFFSDHAPQTIELNLHGDFTK